jgi:hypothetical protein
MPSFAIPWPLCAIASVVGGFVFWRLVEKPSPVTATAFRKHRSRALGA